MAKQYAFFFNSQACNGCKACVIACKDKYDLPVGQSWRRVYEVNGGGWVKSGDNWVNNVFAYYVSISCNHCEDAKCMKACPAAAITKREDGIVLIDQDRCIGCRYCEWACPYAAPQFDEQKGVMGKCTGCSDYVDVGQKPACVMACPTRALDFGEVSELEKKHGRFAIEEKTSRICPLPDPKITTPALVVRPHKHATQLIASAPHIANPEEV